MHNMQTVDMASTTDTYTPTISVDDTNLQLPFIPDPGKPDEDLASDVKLDFSVRLGTSLAREHQTGSLIRNDLRLAPNHIPHGNQPGSRSPRSPKSYRTSSVNGENTPRIKRESSIFFKQAVTPPKEESTENALAKLQRVIKTVRIILRVCIAMKRYSQTAQTKTWSFMEMYLHLKEDINQVVAFNPQSFARVDPESGKLKKLLSLPPADRTIQDVKAVIALLRGNTSFQDYPTHVQVQLACCMEYQSYEVRRIILKQGHRPEAFYILLSGYVMANVEEKDTQSGRTFIKTVKEVGPGNTFGEIALIDGGRRTATIVCKTNVQLLVIMKEDFDNIIRKQLLKQINEQAAFCRSLPIFKEFPCHLLVENPAHFFFQYFKKGDIVVKDSKESKCIVVVKSGRCLVVSSHENDPWKHKTTLSPGAKKDLEAAFPFYEDMRQLRNFKNKNQTDADKRKDAMCLALLTGKVDKTRLADHGPDVQRPKSTMPRLETDSLSKSYYRQKSNSMTSYFKAVSQKRKEQIVGVLLYINARSFGEETDADLYSDMQDHFWSRRLKLLERSGTAIGSARSKIGSGRLSSKSRTKRPVSSGTRQTVAQIAELNTGTVFGLESLVQKPSVTVSLLSDGAECIFISKRFVLQYANLKVLQIITDIVQTYPSRDIIEEDLKNYRKWKQYKSNLVKEVVKRKQCF